MEQNFFETLALQKRSRPSATCIEDQHGNHTYEDIYHKSVEVAKLLNRITKGHGVVLMTRNDHHFIIGLYAIIHKECVALPVDINNQKNDLKTILKTSNIKYVLTTASLGQGFQLLNEIRGFKLYSSDNLSDNIHKHFPNAAFIRYTSGTTGRSKGVVISHKAVFARTLSAQKTLQFKEGKNMLWLLPMAFHFVVSLCLYVRYGVKIIAQERFMAERLFKSITSHNIHYIYGSPLHVKMLSKLKPDNHKLELFIATTSVLDLKDASRFMKNFNLPITQAFGIIEVGLPLINLSASKTHPEAAGQQSIGHDVVVLDDQQNTCNLNEIGQLAIRKNDSMFSGYLSPVTPIDKVLENGFFITGDLSYEDQNNTFYIKGRKKNVILVAGNKIFPEEVEIKINTLPAIKESKVYGERHELFGNTICADIVLQNDLSEKDLRTKIQGILPSNLWPHEINIVNKIKRTQTGKILRH